MNKFKDRTGMYAFFMVLSCIAAPLFAGSTFTIDYTPGQPIPTSISPGGTVSAYYTVTNNTQTTRAGYTVTGLPATVTQNTATGYCSSPITLAGHASCNLKLDITGQVSSYFALCHGTGCTRAARPLSVASKANLFTPLVAGGTYQDHSSNFHPLVAASNDNGTTWRYTLSANLQNTGIFSVFCRQNNTCLAVGGVTSTPIIYTSSDGAITWTNTLSNTPLPHNYVSGGRFVGTTCNDSICLAAGNYKPASGNSTPMIAVSQNNGASWRYTLDSQRLPQGFVGLTSDDTNLGVSCSGNTCVYGKAYASTDNHTYPFVASSTNQGQSWVYSLDSRVAMPADFGGGFQAGYLSCNNTVCIYAGRYNSNLPIIFTGAQHGTQWSFTLDSSNIPVGSTSTKLLGAACTDTYCIGAGNYEVSGTQYPLIATSTDNKATNWNYTLITAPSDSVGEAQFFSANCSGTYCVAVGSYKKIDAHTYPMIATSKDGHNWTYTYDGTKTLPSGVSDVVLLSVSCSGKYCIAAGGFGSGGTDFLANPVLLLSADYGANWSFKITNTTPQLPNDFDFGFFFGTSISGTTSLLPKSLTFLINND